MSENEMPEMPRIIWAALDPDTNKNPSGVWARGTETAAENEYIKIAEYADLQRQNAALKEFVKSMLYISFDGGDADGGQIQDAAEKNGIIVPRKATEKDVEDMSYFDIELGDMVYDKTDWILTDAPMPVAEESTATQSRAQIAREFIKEIEDRADKIRHAPGFNNQDDEAYYAAYFEARALIRNEWEAAEVTPDADADN